MSDSCANSDHLRMRNRKHKTPDPIRLGRNRQADIARLKCAAELLPLDKEFDCVFKSAKESRREKQNRLLHRWCGQFTKHCNERSGWAFGWSKFEILLPMKLGCDHDATRERAEFEWAVISRIKDYSIQTEVAHDLIRSKNIPVRIFADYLTELQIQAAEQGCVLTSSEDMMMEALMREVA